MENEKKGFFAGAGSRLKAIFEKLKGIVKQYPVTICSIFAASLLYSIDEITWMSRMENANEGIWVTGLGTAAWVIFRFSAGALFTEEFLKSGFMKKEGSPSPKAVTAAGFGAAAVLAMLFTYFSGWHIFSFRMFEMAAEYSFRLETVYLALVITGTVYMMYRRLKAGFETYVLSTFIGCAQTSLFYGLFALGLAALYGIFWALIYPIPMTLLSATEKILCSGIYIPAIILCFSSLKRTDGKLSKAFIGYALMGLLSAAFLLVYVYIVKILITREMPRNQLFLIASLIFTLGLPIWTMSRCYRPELPGKAAVLMPYLFIPLLVLQGICMGMRIADYGITLSRYAGLALMLFEAVCIFLYIFKRGKHIDKILHAAVIMAAVIFIVPGVNMCAVSTRSQGLRLMNIMAAGVDAMSGGEKKSALDAYHAINDCGPEGRKFLEKCPEEWKEFRTYLGLKGDYYDEDLTGPENYYCYSVYPVDMDISEYSRLTRIKCDEYAWSYEDYDKMKPEELPEMDLEAVKFTPAPGHIRGEEPEEPESIILDIKDIVEAYCRSGDEDFFLNTNGFVLDDGRKLFVTDMNVTFSPETGKVGSLDADMLLFEK